MAEVVSIADESTLNSGRVMIIINKRRRNSLIYLIILPILIAFIKFLDNSLDSFAVLIAVCVCLAILGPMFIIHDLNRHRLKPYYRQFNRLAYLWSAKLTTGLPSVKNMNSAQYIEDYFNQPTQTQNIPVVSPKFKL